MNFRRNMQKAQAYIKLVEKVTNLYIPPVKSGKVTLEAFGNDYGGCKEINLYTYWQGLNYAKNTPPIKYLLVGQDWGSKSQISDTFAERIKKINQGKSEIPYIDTEHDKNIFTTDKNLIELFRQLGYGITENESIEHKRYPELFFTNFCLGYRKENSSKNMSKELMEHDIEYFQDLCKVLEPENILCLGKLTFRYVYESLTGKKATKLKYYNKGYNYFIEHHEKISVKYIKSTIYPLAHCGTIGTMNRNRDVEAGAMKMSLNKQMKDWSKIAQETK